MNDTMFVCTGCGDVDCDQFVDEDAEVVLSMCCNKPCREATVDEAASVAPTELYQENA